MGKIHCRITRRHGVSGTNQHLDCLRATIVSPNGRDSRQMGEDSTNASSFNNIDMVAAVEVIRTYLNRYLSCGETVHLEGIGSFQLAIGLKEMASADAKVTARQIEVKGITFRPADSLLTDIRSDATFVIDEDRRDLVTRDESFRLLQSYFQDSLAAGLPALITVKRFAAISNSSANTAGKRLRAFCAAGYLTRYDALPGHYAPTSLLLPPPASTPSPNPTTDNPPTSTEE